MAENFDKQPTPVDGLNNQRWLMVINDEQEWLTMVDDRG